jgi:hypothetical protein
VDWNAIGAIGEVAGAIAVVITLLFLAKQLRENTKSTNAAAHSDRTHRNIMLTLWSGEHGVGLIRRKVERGEEISDEERELLFCLDLASLRHFEDMHYQRTAGITDDETWAANLSGLDRRSGSEGFAEMYEQGKFGLRTSFQKLIEDKMQTRSQE